MQTALDSFAYSSPAPLNSSALRGGRARIAPTLLSLTLVLVAVGMLGAVGYRAGRGIDSDLRFLEPLRSPTNDEALVAYPVEYALRSDEANDVIFVGDSTCRCGIDPVLFERVSGLRAYNLGSLGSAGPSGFLITAEAYLLKHPRPKLVVLCVTPVAFEFAGDVIADKIRSNLPLRFEANYGPEVPGLVPFHESIEYFVKRGSVSLWDRAFNIGVAPRTDVRDLPMVGRLDETFRTAQQKTQAARGYDPLPGLHGKRIDLDAPGVPVRIDPTWDHNVRLLVERCERLGIPLLIRFSPMPDDLAQVKDFSPVERWAREIKATYPHLHMGQPILMWYDWALCYDNLHLNGPGTAVYMKWLAKDIQPLISGSTSGG